MGSSTRCRQCWNLEVYCTCLDRRVRLVASNEVFVCICCDTPMATDHVENIGYVCGMCMGHFQGHPTEIAALHRRALMQVVETPKPYWESQA